MWQTLIPELSFEILNQVFTGSTLPVCEPHLFPWHLGHICRAWRAAFVSSPEFWSSFMVDLKTNELESLDRCKSLVEMCLERSKGRPISFRFAVQGKAEYNFNRSDLLDNGEFHLWALQKLTEQSTRWKNAYFHVPLSALETLYTVKGRLPILRSIELLVDTLPSDMQYADLFENTPQLRRVSLDDHTIWNLDWASLSTIHFPNARRRMPGSLMQFLSQIQSVEELYVEGIPESSSPLPRVSLPSLKRLGVGTVEYLDSFETPWLEELYFTNSKRSPGMDILTFEISLTSIIMRPKKHLKKFSIHIGPGRPSKEAEILLEYVPNIVSDLSVVIDDISALNVLPSCSASPYLKSITAEMWHYENHAQTNTTIVEIAKSWRQSSTGTSGIGKFGNLRQFTIGLRVDDKTRVTSLFKRFVESLKEIFESRHVHCDIKSLSDDLHWHRRGDSPQFQFF